MSIAKPRSVLSLHCTAWLKPCHPSPTRCSGSPRAPDSPRRPKRILIVLQTLLLTLEHIFGLVLSAFILLRSLRITPQLGAELTESFGASLLSIMVYNSTSHSQSSLTLVPFCSSSRNRSYQPTPCSFLYPSPCRPCTLSACSCHTIRPPH